MSGKISGFVKTAATVASAAKTAVKQSVGKFFNHSVSVGKKPERTTGGSPSTRMASSNLAGTKTSSSYKGDVEDV